MFGIDDAITEGLRVINKFIPDKDVQVKIEAEFRAAMLAADVQIATAQSDTNKVEEKKLNNNNSSSMLKSS